MRHIRVIFFLGFVTLLLPFIGVPASWKSGVYALIGIALLALSYQLYKKEHATGKPRAPNAADTFVENDRPSLEGPPRHENQTGA